ncbi:MAG TPA: hypothetical protein DFS52_17165 [Myxococcales bacterium]|nr:hypothetical protein [Myxococcales bacterium]
MPPSTAWKNARGNAAESRSAISNGTTSSSLPWMTRTGTSTRSAFAKVSKRWRTSSLPGSNEVTRRAISGIDV